MTKGGEDTQRQDPFSFDFRDGDTNIRLANAKWEMESRPSPKIHAAKEKKMGPIGAGVGKRKLRCRDANFEGGEGDKEMQQIQKETNARISGTKNTRTNLRIKASTIHRPFAR